MSETHPFVSLSHRVVPSIQANLASNSAALLATQHRVSTTSSQANASILHSFPISNASNYYHQQSLLPVGISLNGLALTAPSLASLDVSGVQQYLNDNQQQFYLKIMKQLPYTVILVVDSNEVKDSKAFLYFSQSQSIHECPSFTYFSQDMHESTFEAYHQIETIPFRLTLPRFSFHVSSWQEAIEQLIEWEHHLLQSHQYLPVLAIGQGEKHRAFLLKQAKTVKPRVQEEQVDQTTTQETNAAQSNTDESSSAWELVSDDSLLHLRRKTHAAKLGLNDKHKTVDLPSLLQSPPQGLLLPLAQLSLPEYSIPVGLLETTCGKAHDDNNLDVVVYDDSTFEVSCQLDTVLFAPAAHTSISALFQNTNQEGFSPFRLAIRRLIRSIIFLIKKDKMQSQSVPTAAAYTIHSYLFQHTATSCPVSNFALNTPVVAPFIYTNQHYTQAQSILTKLHQAATATIPSIFDSAPLPPSDIEVEEENKSTTAQKTASNIHTSTYNDGVTPLEVNILEKSLESQRQSLHQLLGLEHMTRPLFRIINSVPVSASSHIPSQYLSGDSSSNPSAAASSSSSSTSSSSALSLTSGPGGLSPFTSSPTFVYPCAQSLTAPRLFDVHHSLDLPFPDKERSQWKISTVQGSYAYYHYMQDKFNDNVSGGTHTLQTTSTNIQRARMCACVCILTILCTLVFD